MPASPEMQRMQQDAVRRAMEMQSRSRSGPELHLSDSRQHSQQGRRGVNTAQQQNRTQPQRSAHTAAEQRTPSHLQMESPKPASPQANENSFASAGDILDLLLQDSERTLILLLILLLSSENVDPSLIFALLYLAL